jgi:hypothetical protein
MNVLKDVLLNLVSTFPEGLARENEAHLELGQALERIAEDCSDRFTGELIDQLLNGISEL